MDEATFWATGQTKGDCLLWPLSGNQGGYGHVWFGGRLYQTHRLAYELKVGPVPSGSCVLHKCDVRRCYNPSHLWLGSRGDNNRDRSQKGRTARLHGGSNPNSKLNYSQAQQIRSKYIARYERCRGANGSIHWRSNAKELMAQYGIGRAALYRILRGATYATGA